MSMRAPAPLRPGDEVVILSTARKISEEELAPAIELLEGWGLRVRLGKTIGAEDHQFAGNDQLRLEDLQSALDEPSVRAVLCARGGYGTVRIMDGIRFGGFMDNPKWIVGYSDITYLHALINFKLKVQTLHASMPVNFKTNTDEALESVRKGLFGEPLAYEWKANPLNRAGNASGECCGGNLSILYSLTGTSSGFDTNGRILCLEDLDEYLYHIDRMLMNLKRSGKFGQAAAVLVGGMTDMNDNAIPFGSNAHEIIADRLSESDIPLVFDAPFGHIDNNCAIPMGRIARLEANTEKVSLTF